MIKYTSLLLGLMVKFSPMVFYLFGPPVFIYSVVRFRSLDPVYWKLIFVGFIIGTIVGSFIGAAIESFF